MITLSVGLGATPPTHVAPALQLPVAAEVMVRACELYPIITNNIKYTLTEILNINNRIQIPFRPNY
jgi:hypothetical protein